MSDDDGVIIEEGIDPFETFEDPVAQRAMAFVHLAGFADNAVNETTRDLTYTMMRKVIASIKSPSTADLKVIDGGKS